MSARVCHVYGILLLALGLLTPPAQAQDGDDLPPLRSLDVGVVGGIFFSSDWSDLVVLGSRQAIGGFAEQVLLRDLAVDPGPVGDVSLTYWEGRYGLRLHAGLSRSCLSVGVGCVVATLSATDRTRFALAAGDDALDTWLYDIGGVVRALEPRPGQWLRPYVFFGAGGVTYDPGVAVRTVLPGSVEFGGSPGRLQLDENGRLVIVDVSVVDSDPFLLAVDEVGFETLFAGVLGFGTDLRVPRPGGFGIRIEISDHVTKSPLDVRLAGLGGGFFSPDDPDEVGFDFGLVHNLRFTAGLMFEWPVAGLTDEPE